MKLAPLTTFLVLSSSIASIASAAPVATFDARIPKWNSAAASASCAGPAPQQDIIPPHASGPGKPVYVDICNNPDVIKNASCKPRREAEAKAASEFATQAGLQDKRDVAVDGDGFVRSGLESLERRGVALILADSGRPEHQNVWHEINRVQHQAGKKNEKRLTPQPVFDAVGTLNINCVKNKDTNTKREVRNLPKLEPQPVYDAEGNAYLNGVMIKDEANNKREVKNLPKLEPEPNQDLYVKLPRDPELVLSGKKLSSANTPAIPVGMSANIPTKPGQKPPGKFAGKGNLSFKESVETYGYENVPHKRDVPGHPKLDKRQACATPHNSSGGLARLHEDLTASHLLEVQATLREHWHGDCILTIEDSKETSMSQDGAETTQITTQTTAIEPATAAADSTSKDSEGQDDVPGNQNASHGLVPLVEQQETHHQHTEASYHAAPAEFAAAVDHGEHGDGSTHHAVKEGENAKKVEEKKRRRERRLELIPMKKNIESIWWVGVDGVALRK